MTFINSVEGSYILCKKFKDFLNISCNKYIKTDDSKTEKFINLWHFPIAMATKMSAKKTATYQKVKSDECIKPDYNHLVIMVCEDIENKMASFKNSICKTKTDLKTFDMALKSAKKVDFINRFTNDMAKFYYDLLIEKGISGIFVDELHKDKSKLGNVLIYAERKILNDVKKKWIKLIKLLVDNKEKAELLIYAIKCFERIEDF